MEYSDGKVLDGVNVVYVAPEPVLAYRRRTRVYTGPLKKGVNPRQSWHILVMKSQIAFVFEETRKVALLPAFIPDHPLFGPIDEIAGIEIPKSVLSF